MRFYNTLSGSAPHYRRYKMAANHAVGIAVLRSASGSAGLSVSTTTSWEDMVGCTQDKGSDYNKGTDITYSTTQGDKEAVYKVIINPDAMFKMLMNGGGTNGTALADETEGTASTTGLTVTPTPARDYDTVDMINGTAWWTSGANVGQSRKITATETTSFSVTVPWLYDTAVGDIVIVVPHFPGSLSIETTSDLLDANSSVVAGSVGNVCVDLELNGVSDSYVIVMPSDHVFGGSTT